MHDQCTRTVYSADSCFCFVSAVVDCAVSAWGPWSECDVECGTGMMTRSRIVEKQPENGGKHCPSLIQKRGCQGTRCPHNPRSAIKGKRLSLDNVRYLRKKQVK
jgi:hypothetical protein